MSRSRSRKALKRCVGIRGKALLLRGLLGLLGGFSLKLTTINDAVENLHGFGAQVVLKNKAVEAFDFGALAELFDRRGEVVARHEVDGGSVFRKLHFFRFFCSHPSGLPGTPSWVKNPLTDSLEAAKSIGHVYSS